MSKCDLSIVTATRLRHDQIAAQILSVKRQVVGSLIIEHVVVVDGEDDQTSLRVAEQLGLQPMLSPYPAGNYGAGAKAAGITAARGDYVVCWDDDDIYEPHAALSLWSAAKDYDIGLCQVQHLRPVESFQQILHTSPDSLSFGYFSGMGMCVRRELAVKCPIFDGNGGRGTDWRWYQRLLETGATQRLLPIQIGTIVDTYYEKEDPE